MDLAIVLGEAMFYFKQLGLDDESLQRHASLHSDDYDRMQSIVRSTLKIRAVGAVTNEGMRTIVMLILSRVASVAAMSAAEESAKAFLPLFGSVVGVPLSFVGTYMALYSVLNKFEDVAIKVMQRLALSVASTEEYDVESSVSDDAQSAGIDVEPESEEADIAAGVKVDNVD